LTTRSEISNGHRSLSYFIMLTSQLFSNSAQALLLVVLFSAGCGPRLATKSQHEGPPSLVPTPNVVTDAGTNSDEDEQSIAREVPANRPWPEVTVVEVGGVSSKRAEANGNTWNADGTLLAVAVGRTVSLRKADDRFREVRRLEPNEKDGAPIADVAFSSDGQWMVTATEKGTMSLWSTTTWKKSNTWIHALPPQLGVPPYLQSCEFSPDGRLLVSSTGDGGWGGTMILWDFRNGRKERELEGHSGGMALSFTQDGKTVSGFSAMVGFRDWSVSTGKLLGSESSFLHKELKAAVALVDFEVDPDELRWRHARTNGKVAFFLGDQPRVAVVNTITGDHYQLETGEEPRAVGLSKDGMLAWARLPSGLVFWHAVTRERLARVVVSGSVTVSPGGKQVAFDDRSTFSVLQIADRKLFELLSGP
jgi:WD domain, G-beta repeat